MPLIPPILPNPPNSASFNAAQSKDDGGWAFSNELTMALYQKKRDRDAKMNQKASIRDLMKGTRYFI